MAKRGREAASLQSGAPPTIKLPSAKPLWLQADNDRYLLLEDPDTGDILLPLLYLKPILGPNYSRKLASLKHRQVTVPAGSPEPLASKGGLLFWQWAFEAPAAIKAIVRREMGEDNTPQGHLRLVLAPIVYNSLSQQADLRGQPLFQALHAALRHSSYWPLLIQPVGSVVKELDAKTSEGSQAAALFAGPPSLQETALKYMFLFNSYDEVEQSKKARTTGAALKQGGAATVEEAMRKALAGTSTLQETASNPSTGTAPPAPSHPPVATAGFVPFEQQPQLPHLEQLPVGMLPPGSVQIGSRTGTPRLDAAAMQLGLPAAQQHVGAPGQILGPPPPHPLHQQQPLMLLQLRQMLQQELLPMCQQIEVLTQEVAILKSTLAGGAHVRPPTPAPQAPSWQAVELLQATNALPPQQPVQQAFNGAASALEHNSLASLGLLVDQLKAQMTSGHPAAHTNQPAPAACAAADRQAVATGPAANNNAAAEDVRRAGSPAGGQNQTPRSINLSGPSSFCFNHLGRLLTPANGGTAPAGPAGEPPLQEIGDGGQQAQGQPKDLLAAGASALMAAIRNSINSGKGGNGGAGGVSELARMWESQTSVPLLLGQGTLGTFNLSEFMKELQPGALEAAVHALAQYASQEQQLAPAQQQAVPAVAAAQ